MLLMIVMLKFIEFKWKQILNILSSKKKILNISNFGCNLVEAVKTENPTESK